MEDRLICAHEPCTCSALIGQDYCGDACREADERKDPNEIHCHCGHEDCGGEPEIPEDVTGMLLASQALAEA